MPTSETKIVKAAPKKKESKDEGQSKVQIRQADFEAVRAQVAQQKAEKAAAAPVKKDAPKPAARTAAVPPMGKPMPKAANPAMKTMPIGRPMPKNAVPQKKADTPQPVKEEAAVQEEIITAAEIPAAEAPKAETPKAEAPKAEKPAKEAAPKKEESKAAKKTAEAPKAKAEKKPEKKTEKTENKETAKEEPKAPERKPVPIDYVPGIGLKIIKRAADATETKVEAPTNIVRHEEKKPKEFVGKKKRDDNGSNAPRTKQQTHKSAGEKVVAFTASPSQDTRKGRKDKDKRDKHSKFDEIPADLSRTKKNKHSKYKEKVEEVDEEQLFEESLEVGTVVIQVPITVAGFCEQVEKTTAEAIMALMKMGIMANINANLDEETAVLLGMELGVNVAVSKVIEEEPEEGLNLAEDRESDLKPRPPVITVMGHVDHGKTSLLDAIRNTNVTSGEAGGITQHIGASEVEINGQRIVFLDTPGHEAFTAMRARGAYITDIAVLVVAADDSVKPQTIESISHAKAAGVPIIVAINKMDKPAANPDLVKKDLADNGVLVEEWGGNVISVPVSAKTGMGIPQLLEMILLQAEMLELKANPNRMAQGSVIEARLDKNRGPVATLLVTKGTLQAGQAIVAGTASGRIRVMSNWRGETIKKAGPSRAVEITGLTEVPEAGDEFYAVKDDKTAREIAERRAQKLREEVMAKNASVSLEKLFSQMEEGELKELNLIIKADVQGSVGALEQSLEKLQNENVRVKIIHTGVGAINESDVMLAGTSNAVIIGFNVRPSAAVQAQADNDGVEIRTYRVIYEIIEDIEAAMKGMLDPEFKEVVLGTAEVRETFKVPNVGLIAGAYVVSGKITRSAQLRLVREGIVIHEGNVGSLKRFKDDAKEVATGFECGIGIENFNDIKVGDVIEAFEMQEIKRD